MYIRKSFIAVVFLLSGLQLTNGQNNTNSPYTRFGYGDISESVPNDLRGMGGTAIGNRSQRTINPVNPASHSSVDSLTFSFDVAADFRYSRFSDLTSSNKTFNANLDYITMRFPIGKWLGFSAGLIPYSFAGYNFMMSGTKLMPVYTGEKRDTIKYSQYFNGNGGFSQVYGGLSAKMFNHVALGVNAYYLFGSINNSRTQTVSTTTNVFSSDNQIKASDFRLRYGLQLYNTFNKKHDVTLGFIFENKKKLNGTFSNIENDTIITYDKKFELPMMFGAGLSYKFDNKLTVGIDYKMQSWKDALFFSKKDSLQNASSFSMGAEYMPNPYGRKTSDRICYRVGFNTGNPYYKTSQPLPNNFGLSVGVGIPMRDNFTNKISYVNASLEYGKMGSNTMLREDYLKLTISASFSEFWFFKPKF